MSRSRRRRQPQHPVQSAAPRESRVDFHRGEVLYKLANTYNSLLLTLVEMAQNAIDAEAGVVFIGVDLKNRRVTVADNGNGASDQKFEQALASVGKGIKSKDKLGRFGLGLIAPLNKCAHFTFTSKVIAHRPVRWTFRGSDIRAQHHEVNIPREELREMPLVVKLFRQFLTDRFDVPWSTVVNLAGVTPDKVISLVDLDELEGQIRTKLGMAMRKQGVSIRVVLVDENGAVSQRDIDPVMFSGEKFEVVTYPNADGPAGLVEVELYRAPKLGGKRDGQVLVMELDGNYPVPIKEVVRQFRGGKEYDGFAASLSILTSGFFEGIIRCEHITLAPERTKFDYNDALFDLFLVLECSWYEQCGQRQFEDEQERTREQRYQELGLESQDRLKQFLPRSLYDKVRSVVKFGRLGNHHLDPASGKPGEFEDEPSLRTGAGGVNVPRNPRDPEEPRARTREPKDRPGDLPTGSYGPRGQQRQIVKGDSEGIWFEYSALFANSHLWEFDSQYGIITFNTKHPVWVKLDETNGRHTSKNEKQIMDLQEWLALEILTLLSNYPDPEDFELNRGMIDDKIKSYTELFIVHKRR